MNLMRRLCREEDGQGLTEYTLVVVLVALVFWMGVRDTQVGQSLVQAWAKVLDCVTHLFRAALKATTSTFNRPETELTADSKVIWKQKLQTLKRSAAPNLRRNGQVSRPNSAQPILRASYAPSDRRWKNSVFPCSTLKSRMEFMSLWPKPTRQSGKPSFLSCVRLENSFGPLIRVAPGRVAQSTCTLHRRRSKSSICTGRTVVKIPARHRTRTVFHNCCAAPVVIWTIEMCRNG